MALDSTQLAPPAFGSTAPLAGVPVAGLGTRGARETAASALAWGPRPATPPGIAAGGFQHYARQPPGAAVRRPGAAHDAPRPGPFGARSGGAGGGGAADCLGGTAPDSEVARWWAERAEDVYQRWGDKGRGWGGAVSEGRPRRRGSGTEGCGLSPAAGSQAAPLATLDPPACPHRPPAAAAASHKREPLGAAPSRGYCLPDGLGTREAFGVPLRVREQERLNSTKALIFPPQPGAGGGDEASTTALYRRTHGSFAPGAWVALCPHGREVGNVGAPASRGAGHNSGAPRAFTALPSPTHVPPGEQRTREYDWGSAGIDPATHRFGLSGADTSRRRSAQQRASMKQILQPELDEGIEVRGVEAAGA
jgi:hypothetical protein